jgi:transposase
MTHRFQTSSMSRFRPIDRQTDYLLPPSVQEWLPEAHLARYVVDVVEALDLSALERAYAGRGSDAYHPAMLLSLLIYGYATGTHSSRKIERATYDSLAFRFIACNQHPDHDTLAASAAVSARSSPMPSCRCCRSHARTNSRALAR